MLFISSYIDYVLCVIVILKCRNRSTQKKNPRSFLFTPLRYDHLTCYSEADAGVKTDDEPKIPEDTAISAEEEEHLQKKRGEE